MDNFKAGNKKEGERAAISEHHEDKVNALKNRFFIETLSFLGITIGFTLSLYNVWRTRQQIEKQLNNLD